MDAIHKEDPRPEHLGWQHGPEHVPTEEDLPTHTIQILPAPLKP